MKKVSIIGSGFSSLAAASVLAQAGHEVTVFEKNDTLGGRARTFQSDGLTFDMGPSWYWMPEVFESFFNRFGKSVSDYYELRQLDPSYTIFYGKDDVLRIPAATDELFTLFESIESGSGTHLKKFLNEAAYKYEVGMQDLVFKPGLSLLEYLDRRFLAGILRMHVFQSFHRYVRRYFSDRRLIQLMEFPVLFLGGMPQNTPALYSLMNHAGLTLGTWYPMGGMGKIIEAMVDLARELGVRFQTGVSIHEIVVNNAHTRGVRNTSTVHPADAVLSGADYHHVESALLPIPYRSYDERYWNKRVMAPSSLIFYLGVDKKLQNLEHHNLFFDEDFARHTKEIYETPKWPSKPLFYVCCPSKTDPAVAPEGKENLFILVPLAAGIEDSDAMREQMYDIVIQRLQTLTSQQIRDHVFFKRCYCLNDFRQDYNAFKGNAYGLANTLRQTAIFKPSIRSRKVKNLFFTGQLTVPGPGVPPSLISGQVAAAEVLKYLDERK